MVLGGDVLLKKSRSNDYLQSISVNENSSLFFFGLDLLRESDKAIIDSIKQIHIESVNAESKDSFYLTEFSFKDTIDTIIKWFIKVIEQLFGKFKSMIQKIIYSDNTIKKYENRLRNMKGEFSIDTERYNYTCFDADVPSINLKTQFSLNYDDLMGKLEDIRNLTTKEERLVRMNMIEADSCNESLDPAYYDRVRQTTLDTSYMISEADYATELFNKFRDGGKTRATKINSTELSFILDRYLNNKTLMKKVEESKRQTIDAAENIRKKINGLSLQKLNTTYIPYDIEEETIFNKILQHKTNQVNETCNIFVLAFSAKLDAIKESKIQDKRILFEAIRFINIGGEDL